jgi:hypothetical protein
MGHSPVNLECGIDGMHSGDGNTNFGGVKMMMSQEGATFIRNKVKEIVQAPFLLIIEDTVHGGHHFLANGMPAPEAERVLRLFSSKPLNVIFDTTDTEEGGDNDA